MFVNELYLQPALAARFGDQDPFAQVDRLKGRVYRQVARRRTLRVRLGDQVFFLKRHHGVGWLEIFKNLLAGRLPILGAGSEFRAARALMAAGVSVPEPVAYGERGLNPAGRESFLLSRAIEPSISLEDLAKTWCEARPAAKDWWRLVDAVADVTSTMHRAGINHRDLYICHFLLRPDSFPDAPDLTLIDLHRAQIRPSVPRRWLIKDLGALWFSAAQARPSRRDAYRFILRYTGQPLRAALTEDDRVEFWEAVLKRAQQLHAEARRKGLESFPEPFAQAR